MTADRPLTPSAGRPSEEEDPDSPLWASRGAQARQALPLLGFPGILAECMPGEPQACGASSMAHALGYVAMARAVADHLISHYDTTPQTSAMVAEISMEAALLMASACGD